MTPPTTGSLPLGQEEMVAKIYEAIYVGDGQVGGRPGMLEALNKVVADVEVLKASNNKAAERGWAVALGAAAGVVGSWLKPGG